MKKFSLFVQVCLVLLMVAALYRLLKPKPPVGRSQPLPHPSIAQKKSPDQVRFEKGFLHISKKAVLQESSTLNSNEPYFILESVPKEKSKYLCQKTLGIFRYESRDDFVFQVQRNPAPSRLESYSWESKSTRSFLFFDPFQMWQKYKGKMQLCHRGWGLKAPAENNTSTQRKEKHLKEKEFKTLRLGKAWDEHLESPDRYVMRGWSDEP
jgi:hypothetical protein